MGYVDVNGDGEINSDDRTFIGKPLADYYMGFNFSVNYKSFDLSLYAFAEVGKDMVRNYERDQPNVNRLDYYLDRWTGPGTSNTVPKETLEDFGLSKVRLYASVNNAFTFTEYKG